MVDNEWCASSIINSKQHLDVGTQEAYNRKPRLNGQNHIKPIPFFKKDNNNKTKPVTPT